VIDAKQIKLYYRLVKVEHEKCKGRQLQRWQKPTAFSEIEYRNQQMKNRVK